VLIFIKSFYLKKFNMITVARAFEIVSSHLYQPKVQRLPLHMAAGRVLMANVVCDTDLPPFARVMMDGVALASSDLKNGSTKFKVAGMQQAGEPPLAILEANECIEVMTGAVCPTGADVVVPYEKVMIDGGYCTIQADDAAKGQNIHAQGKDKKLGDVVVQKFKQLNAADIAILASVGKVEVEVASLPVVHIFSTGNELVEIDDVPLPHQIRRSNVYALKELLLEHGIHATQSHLADHEGEIKQKVKEALQTCDVILLSGGVSKGKFDFVPQVMEELGVQKHFHSIAQKPGKPMWFGQYNNTLIFALPGNPVSTFACAVRYFVPWLRLSLFQQATKLYCLLDSDLVLKGTLTQFVQVKCRVNEKAQLLAEPRLGSGSGDFSNLAEANAFAEIAPSTNDWKAGSVVQCYPFSKLW
jgi:molybdopterin molybdotransferase